MAFPYALSNNRRPPKCPSRPDRIGEALLAQRGRQRETRYTRNSTSRLGQSKGPADDPVLTDTLPVAVCNKRMGDARLMSPEVLNAEVRRRGYIRRPPLLGKKRWPPSFGPRSSEGSAQGWYLPTFHNLSVCESTPVVGASIARRSAKPTSCSDAAWHSSHRILRGSPFDQVHESSLFLIVYIDLLTPLSVAST
jgi:hypothetical protein